MKSWRKKLVMAITVIGIPAVLSGAWIGVETLASRVVWASDYQQDRKTQTMINLQIQIDLASDKLRRATDPVVREDYKKRIDRYEKQLQELLNSK